MYIASPWHHLCIKQWEVEPELGGRRCKILNFVNCIELYGLYGNDPVSFHSMSLYGFTIINHTDLNKLTNLSWTHSKKLNFPQRRC